MLYVKKRLFGEDIAKKMASSIEEVADRIVKENNLLH